MKHGVKVSNSQCLVIVSCKFCYLISNCAMLVIIFLLILLEQADAF